MKKCPNCKLWNSENAMRCDCGYDFISNQMEASYVRKEQDTLSLAGALGVHIKNKKPRKSIWIYALIL
ncbi:MAG: hypothetical protein MUO64_09045, partial [Anaerolineales bacterium]|nr:hypothetical protein [Anaerolineales bacterium]